MRYIDLFAGIGGFHYGLDCVSGHHPPEQTTERQGIQDERSVHTGPDGDSGYHCVWSNEWDKYANSVYRKHYGECDSRDIRKVEATDIPDHDLLCGGFPCQAFSVAGKRRGFDDTRGTLFFEIARILREKKPRLCLLENVKGLLNHDNGTTIKVILATLADLGYDVQWQVLNSRNWVPQNRERIFIIGHLRGTARPKVFPLRSDDEENTGEHAGEAQDAHTLQAGYGKAHGGDSYIGEFVDMTTKNSKTTDVARALQSRYYKGYSNMEAANSGVLVELTQNVSDAQRVYDAEGIAKTIKGLGGGMGAKTGLYAVRDTQNDKLVSGVGTLQARSKDYDGCGFQLVEQDNRLMRIRRLTPIECERLQGFPDDWTKYGADGEVISDTQRYKMCGNAVTTNVITEIGKHLCK